MGSTSWELRTTTRPFPNSCRELVNCKSIFYNLCFDDSPWGDILYGRVVCRGTSPGSQNICKLASFFLLQLNVLIFLFVRYTWKSNENMLLLIHVLTLSNFSLYFLLWKCEFVCLAYIVQTSSTMNSQYSANITRPSALGMSDPVVVAWTSCRCPSCPCPPCHMGMSYLISLTQCF